MIKIYHNPRCQKSRSTLKLLENSGASFEVIKYLETPPSEQELKQILTCLNLSPENLIRKNEPIWKENYKHKIFSDEELIQIMLKHPKLIERPIVIKGDRAIIGRPPENVNTIL
jgi:arsenate reductase